MLHLSHESSGLGTSPVTQPCRPCQCSDVLPALLPAGLQARSDPCAAVSQRPGFSLPLVPARRCRWGRTTIRLAPRPIAAAFALSNPPSLDCPPDPRPSGLRSRAATRDAPGSPAPAIRRREPLLGSPPPNPWHTGFHASLRIRRTKGSRVGQPSAPGTAIA